MSPQVQTPFDVVFVVASAGGLETFRALLQALPPGSGRAYVVMQHFDPSRPSRLSELLAGHGPLPVVDVRDGMRLEADRVHVVPSGASLSLEGEALRLAPVAEHLSTPFDRTLASAAAELGPRAVTVVLSGHGADAGRGAVAVRAAGGAVLVQSPDEASHPEMPSHVLDVAGADLCGPVAVIAARLGEPNLPLSCGGTDALAVDAAFSKIADLLRSRKDFDLASYKPGTFRRRTLRRLGLRPDAGGDLEAYVRILETDRAEIDRLADELLVNVTSFLRDADTWALLAGRPLREMLRGRAPELPVRVWVPGCATGQEAYTLAMLLREGMQAAGMRGEARIFASDADTDAIETARLGLYQDVGGLSPERLDRFFLREGENWRVTPELRSMVTFTVHDVLKDPPFSRLDLISCRNLMIYLTPEAQSRLLGLFQFALEPGGLLLLGAAETVPGDDDRFAPVLEVPHLYRRGGPGRGVVAAADPVSSEAMAVDLPQLHTARRAEPPL